jgi:hypothetical protein
MLNHEVESFKFWDIVTLWARERLEHEEVVARALAKAVVRDGLRCQSLDPKWVNGKLSDLELRGYPCVGYRPNPNRAIMIVRAQVLEHLLAVVHRAQTPSRSVITDEFVTKTDFAAWLSDTGQTAPEFWFSKKDRAVGA